MEAAGVVGWISNVREQPDDSNCPDETEIQRTNQRTRPANRFKGGKRAFLGTEKVGEETGRARW